MEDMYEMPFARAKNLIVRRCHLTADMPSNSSANRKVDCRNRLSSRTAWNLWTQARILPLKNA